MAATNASLTGEHIGPALWIKFIRAAVVVFAGFLGAINIASVIGGYGFEWHHIIRAAIDVYRATFYPFYEIFLRPLFNWIGLDLSQPIKDVITLLLAAFGAANAESKIRDGKMLLWNVVLNFIPLMMGAFPQLAQEEVPTALEVRTVLFGRWVGYVNLAAYVVGFFCLLGVLIFVDLKPFIGFKLSSLPAWYWWWMGLGAAAAGAINIIAVKSGKKSLEKSSAVRLLMFVLLLPIYPFILFILVGLTGFILVATILVAPVAAWRTVTFTFLLFGILFGANVALNNGWS